ncbi:MAG: cyclic nucleotide-binding domain-containing protein, partial [Thermodesulfobacteriota bacterium]
MTAIPRRVPDDTGGVPTSPLPLAAGFPVPGEGGDLTGETLSVGEVRSRCRPAGEILLREGAPAASLFLLLEGCVCLYRRSPGGRPAVAGFCRPGDVVGEAMLLGLGTSPVTAVCLGPCVTQELSAAALE